ncbi:hypothetical protein ES703_102065 [subsurface metagenome]
MVSLFYQARDAAILVLDRPGDPGQHVSLQLGKADQSVCFQRTVGNDKFLRKRRGPKMDFPAPVKISHLQTYFIRRPAEQSLLQMHGGSAGAGGITIGEAAGHLLK